MPWFHGFHGLGSQRWEAKTAKPRLEVKAGEPRLEAKAAKPRLENDSNAHREGREEDTSRTGCGKRGGLELGRDQGGPSYQRRYVGPSSDVFGDLLASG